MIFLRLLVALGLLGAGWSLLGVSARARTAAGTGHWAQRASALRPRQAAGGEGARWATRADLRSLSVRGAQAGRLSLGRARGRLLAAEAGSSVLVVGPTQSRKTSGFAVPAVLEWEGPVVAASVKSDLARHTLGWRATKGKVWVYDPSGATGLQASTWSPLPEAATWAGARRVAGSLTEVARSSAGSLSDGDFWYSTAAKLLGPLLMAAAVSGRTMTDVVRWVDEQETQEVSQALESDGATDALRALRATWGRDERQRSAVYTTAETIIEPFADPSVAASAGLSADFGAGVPASGAGLSADFGAGLSAGFSEGVWDAIDPRGLLDGTNTLYLCAPAHDQRRLRPLFATLVTQVVEAAYERAEIEGRPLDPRLLVVLDEAANVAPIADLDVLASTAAGHGVQLVTVWQDLGQIGARYGTRAGSVINNHRAKVFLSGIADPQTLEHASQLVGEHEHPSLATTFDGHKTASTTRSPVVRRLLPADALRRVPPGSAVLISGHLPPARITLRPWQEDRVLRARATAGR